MEQWLHLRLQVYPDHSLSYTIRHSRDGGFILPLLCGCAVFWDRLVKVLGVPEQG
jgi:hypothetical protein